MVKGGIKLTAGDKIRELRKKHGHTLKELGVKIGLTYGALGKIERGEINPTVDNLKKISDVYDVPVSYFLDEIPQELKELDVKWIAFAKELQDKRLTPEEIRAAVELIEKLRK